jgi:phage terminase large subunit-like protein
MSESQKVIGFIERFLTLGGSFLGQPFKLLPFQKALIEDIYQPDEHGGRLRREYLLGVPRKNGKSELAAALAVYHLFADPFNQAPMVISAAGDRLQAKIVFNEACRMVRNNSSLQKHCRVYRDHIETKAGGIYRAVSADAALQQGLNPSFVVADELHVFKNDELIEALTLGSAMRQSPLFLYITTAGHNLDSPLGRKYVYGRQIESGERENPRFGFRWYGPKDGETIDPKDRARWMAYNPAHELMPNFEAEMDASMKTTHQNAFIRFRLNGWTATQSAWLPFGAWEKCKDSSKKLVPGDEVVLGFDGAITKDTTALVACRMRDRHLTVINHWDPDYDDEDWRAPVNEIAEAIERACTVYKVKEVVCDPYFYQQMLLDLESKGLPIVEFKTNWIGKMTPAIRAFYEAVITKTVSHDGDPKLAAHLNNCHLVEKEAGLKLKKTHKNSRRCIDLAIAAVLSLYRVAYYEPPEAEKVSDAFVLEW